MRLPNAEQAQIDPNKLKEYLLSETHPIGRSKARFLHDIGYNESKPEILEETLLKIARTEEIVETVQSVHGTKYIIDGMIIPPQGDQVRLRTVWIVDRGQDYPRFVTAYPL